MHIASAWVVRALTIALLIGLVGCAQVEKKKKAIDMQDKTDNYRKALRWGEYETAVSFIRRRDGSNFTYDSDFYAGIRPVDVEITNREVFLELGETIVTIKIKFYHEDYGSVKSLTDRQTWYFDEESENWFMDGELPDFESALSG